MVEINVVLRVTKFRLEIDAKILLRPFHIFFFRPRLDQISTSNYGRNYCGFIGHEISTENRRQNLSDNFIFFSTEIPRDFDRISTSKCDRKGFDLRCVFINLISTSIYNRICESVLDFFSTGIRPEIDVEIMPEDFTFFFFRPKFSIRFPRQTSMYG